MFLFITQQLNDPRKIITHNVVGTSVEEIHFPVSHSESMFCTPSPIHQTFGQTCESVNTTSHEWMTNLFGDDLNTSKFAAAYLASLQQFDAPYSFGEQGQSSSPVATHIENTKIEQQQHHHHEGKPIIQDRRNP